MTIDVKFTDDEFVLYKSDYYLGNIRLVWKLYEVQQGNFLIDVDVVIQIMRSYLRSEAQLKYSELVVENGLSLSPFSDDFMLNPMAWGLPKIATVSVDWDKVKTDVDQYLAPGAFLIGMRATMSADGMTWLMRELSRTIDLIRKNNQRFTDKMRAASRTSMEEIEKTSAKWESRIHGAKLVRDLSGTVLIGAATISPGGAAAGAVAGGAMTGTLVTGAALGTGIKTIAKYQDTGSKTLAAVEATQNIVFTLIPAARGVGLTRGQKIAKVIVSASVDGATAYVPSGNGYDAVAAAASNILADKAMEKIKPVLEKGSMPLLLKIGANPARQYQEIVNKVSSDRMKASVKDGAAAAREAVGHAFQLDATRAVRNDLLPVDEATMHDKKLLELAIIKLRDDDSINPTPWWK